MNIEQKKLSSAQKAGFISLLVFALLTISFSFLQLRNTVYGRFTLSAPTSQKLNLGEYDEMLRLQQIDTDRDGLNDYEELFIYNTSPYIPDTDSDGFTDKEEIEAGTDPLCPEGKLCAENEFGVGVGVTTTPASPLFDASLTPSDIVLGSQFSSDATTVDGQKFVEVIQDPVLLRQIILSTGQISPEDLDRIDDVTLVEFAKQLISDQSNIPVLSTTTTPSN